MPNIFGALEIGKRALQTQQTAIQTSQHNVANANTPGYSRQAALITTAPSLPLIGFGGQAPASLGTGTQVSTINQIRDQFLDVQIREMTEDVNRYSRLNDVYDVTEIVFNELSKTTDINRLFSKFWNAWETLAQDPTDRALRVDLVQQADTLIGDIHNLYTQLNRIQGDQDRELHIKIRDINQKSALIAQLNGGIVAAESGGALANDLRDKRILLVEELASLSNIEVAELNNGSLNVSVEGVPLVQGNESRQFHIATRDGLNRVFSNDGTELHFSAGEVGGIMVARDLAIPDLQQQLDELASTFVEEINFAHRQGYSLDGATTGVNFFAPYSTVYELGVTQEGGRFYAALPNGERAEIIQGQRTTLIPARDDAVLTLASADGLQAGSAIVKVLNGGFVQVVDDGGTGLTESHLSQGGSALPLGEYQVDFELRGTQIFARLDRGRAVAVDAKAKLVAGDPSKAIQVQFNQMPTAEGSLRFTVDRRAQQDPTQTQLLSAGTTGIGPGTLQGFVSTVDIRGAAERLAISDAVRQDVGLVAAAETPAPGDNSNALRIAALQDVPMLAGDTLTVDAFYGSIVTGLGIQVEETKQNLASSGLVLQQMQNRRESISGVSLDEEMTNIIRFQNVYNAAARLVTIVDSMMDTVINRMGLTR